MKARKLSRQNEKRVKSKEKERKKEKKRQRDRAKIKEVIKIYVLEKLAFDRDI